MKRRQFISAGLGLTVGGLVGGRDVFGALVTGATRLALRSTPLANPIEQMATSYDNVVIGSGYGASVMAARLTGTTGSLCVLERGREWLPGDFPTTPLKLAGSLRRGRNPLGLFDISSPLGGDVDIIGGNGLGGTSLINAAIAIRPLQNVFLEKEWPEEIQQAALNGELDRFYNLAESVLKPALLKSISRQAKTQAHLAVTQAMGRRHGVLNLNIQPENSAVGVNAFGAMQGPCIQCGDCCGGCNFGAKNTLTTNYLALAKRKGAEIYTQCEVDYIEKTSKGYDIHIVYYDNRTRMTHKIVVQAKKVFVGAGAKGSTEILNRSQSDAFRFSEALGTRLSANGDVMGLAYNTRYKTNILALGGHPEMISSTHQPGPIIASYADYREPSIEGDVNSQFLLLDGVIPSGLRNTVGTAFAQYADKSGIFFDNVQKQRIARDIEFGSSEEGALNHSMLYFACGHDSSGGKMIYSRKKRRFTRYVWRNVVQEPTFQRINKVMKKFADNMEGVFIPNPRSTVFGERIQATHPLGGCPMGSSASKGVVDHLGRVYDARSGGFHENLHVVDASIIPRSLAATPLLTITALAERIAENLTKK